ncbi:translation initiation factor IF-2-like [Equus quagga]|uniref:translation initiation factor IF-2-like n=1 Tax=Equus quagga TaxID=89248 RepID=UPI001EE1F62F|nr:translation initiation factor IF-2-like [Equus quagga]
MTEKENQLREKRIGPRGSVRVSLKALFGRHPESEGPRRPRRPHLPEEAADRAPGAGARARPQGRGSPGPAPRRPPWPRRGGRNPAPQVSARRRRECQGPRSGAARAPEAASASPGARSRLPARPRRLPHLPAPCGSPAERAPSPTWRPRRASRTSRRDPAALGSSGAGARRRPRSAAAAGSSPGRRQRTCCAACHGRSGPRRSLSPTTTWRPRPPQEAGGRGGRRRAGQLTTRPPARCRAPTARPREPAVGPGAAPHIHSPGHRTPQAWPKGAAVPSGKPRSPGPGSPSRSCDDPPGSSSPRLASYPGEGWWKMPSPHHHLTPSSIFWV